jgi:hypothetical protein
MAMDASELMYQFALDALGDHIVILDKVGRILAVNASWNRFASVNGNLEMARVGLGVNYLDVCRQATHSAADEAEAQNAREALYGISQVLDGLVERFSLDYGCHSPNEQRWFRMTVSPLGGEPGEELSGVVVAHVDITTRKSAERERETLLLRLNDATATIEVLADLLPICGRCRQARADNAYWERVGAYLAAWPDGAPPPGLCPACQEK